MSWAEVAKKDGECLSLGISALLICLSLFLSQRLSVSLSLSAVSLSVSLSVFFSFPPSFSLFLHLSVRSFPFRLFLRCWCLCVVITINISLNHNLKDSNRRRAGKKTQPTEGYPVLVFYPLTPVSKTPASFVRPIVVFSSPPLDPRPPFLLFIRVGITFLPLNHLWAMKPPSFSISRDPPRPGPNTLNLRFSPVRTS